MLFNPTQWRRENSGPKPIAIDKWNEQQLRKQKPAASSKAATPKQQLSEFRGNYLADLKQVYFRLRAVEPKLFEAVMHGDILAPGNWLSGIQQLRIIG